jgi:hypothetical protein
MVSGTSFISKKTNKQKTRILKKISPKNIPVPSGSGIRYIYTVYRYVDMKIYSQTIPKLWIISAETCVN